MDSIKDLIRALLVSSLLTIMGCRSIAQPSSITATQPSTSSNSRPMNSPIPFQVLNFGYTPLEEGFHPQPKALVFQDQKSWAAFWKTSQRLDANLQTPAAPKVDFSKQTIIGVTPGSRRTGGYSMTIDRVELKKTKAGDRILIHYSESTPGQGCMVTQATTTPSVFISIPKSNLPVDLQGRRFASVC